MNEQGVEFEIYARNNEEFNKKIELIDFNN
jgi:hypothetical protein